MGWVFLSIFIGIAVISAISHLLKNQQQADAEPRTTKKRSTNREEKVRLTNDQEQDRFLAEIDRLRKKATTGPKPIPTVKQAKPVAKKVKPTTTTLRTRLEEIPAAVVVPTPRRHEPLPTTAAEMGTLKPISTIATIATVHTVHKPAAAGTSTAGKMTAAISGSARPDPTTPFGSDLLALLKTRNAVPMAVVLQEILGSPKCKS